MITSTQPPYNSYGHEIEGDWYHEKGLCADRTGRTNEAFPAYQAAKNCWRRSDNGRDASQYLQKVERLRHQSKSAADLKIDDVSLNRLVVFAGFPRSGTTLLEAMLGAHPDIVTTGEADLLEPALDASDINPDKPAMSVYLENFRSWNGALPEAHEVIVDKLPLNIIHCRRVASAMPDARLVVALRDPRDVVLSCLMQRFRRNAAMQNFDNLEDTVRLYEEVMGLWLEARSEIGIPWFEYRYEDLIEDPEDILGKLLKFAKIPWHEELANYRDVATRREIVTPSYAAVSEPMFKRAAGRWQAYQNFLEPVLPRLDPFVKAFGYET